VEWFLNYAMDQEATEQILATKYQNSGDRKAHRS
jgi:hypothetical protein